MKKKIIIASVAALAVIALIIIIVSVTKKDSYRSIKISEFSGEVYVTRNGKKIEASENVSLRSGDRIETASSGNAILLLDNDKMITMQSNTILSFEAEGTEADSKTIIKVEMGSIVSEVKNKLSANSSYDIVTSNTTMAIRGTKTITTVSKIKLDEDRIYKTFSDNETVNVFGKENTCSGNVDGYITQIMIIEGKVDVCLYSLNDNGDLIYDEQIIEKDQTVTFTTPEDKTPGISIVLEVLRNNKKAILTAFEKMNGEDEITRVTEDIFEFPVVENAYEWPSSDFWNKVSLIDYKPLGCSDIYVSSENPLDDNTLKNCISVSCDAEEGEFEKYVQMLWNSNYRGNFDSDDKDTMKYADSFDDICSSDSYYAYYYKDNHLLYVYVRKLFISEGYKITVAEVMSDADK